MNSLKKVAIILMAFAAASACAAETQSIAEKKPAASPASGTAEREQQVLRNMRPSRGFAYFSGHEGSSANHPAIYAYQAEVQKLVVIGRGYRQEFSIAEADQALQAYKQLLKERGYKVDDPGSGRSPLLPRQ